MKFIREVMLDVLHEEAHEIISDTVDDLSRGAEHHTLIFKIDDLFYRTHYSQGLTVMRDELPWEYESELELTPVRPVEKTIIVYEEIKS